MSKTQDVSSCSQDDTAISWLYYIGVKNNCLYLRWSIKKINKN